MLFYLIICMTSRTSKVCLSVASATFFPGIHVLFELNGVPIKNIDSSHRIMDSFPRILIWTIIVLMIYILILPVIAV